MVNEVENHTFRVYFCTCINEAQNKYCYAYCRSCFVQVYKGWMKLLNKEMVSGNKSVVTRNTSVNI